MALSYPPINPGGEYKKAVRTILASWIDAQAIPGLEPVWKDWAPTFPDEWQPVLGDSSSHACAVAIWVPTTPETRVTVNGPDDRGGIELRPSIELKIYHRTFFADAYAEAQDDYDRIVDRLKDCMRGPGRNLGRPDFIFLAGESSSGQPNFLEIQDEPVAEDEGPLDLWGTLYFQVLVYLPSTYPTA